jgi:hypothetical protein
MDWILLSVMFAAFGVGVAAGWRWHRQSMLSAIRKLAPIVAAEPPPIDHDAMLRIIKQHQPGGNR